MYDWDRRAYGGGVYREKKENPADVHSRFRKKLLTVTLIILAMIFTAGVVASVFLLFPDYEKVEQKPDNIIFEEQANGKTG